MYDYHIILSLLRNPAYRLDELSKYGFYRWLSDEEYIRRYWKAHFGRKLDLENPVTLFEKLQWLKLYYRKPEFIDMVDKYTAKEIVAEKLGREHITPTIGVWDSPGEIDLSGLPEQFVLKPTHDSGGLVVCRDRKNFDWKAAKKKLAASMKHNYYWHGREWPYKHVRPRIIAEPLIEELGKPDSLEYKITCLNGKAVFVTICSGIAHDDDDKRTNDHFDRGFNRLPWKVIYKPAKVPPKKPEQWEELFRFGEALAEGIPYLRVDTYIIGGKILFGEMTFFTWSGFRRFEPEEWDEKLGRMLKLPEKKVILD